MEKSQIENKIVKLLTDMYPGSEYKALVTAMAIVDLLIAEKLITPPLSKTEAGNSAETTK